MAPWNAGKLVHVAPIQTCLKTNWQILEGGIALATAVQALSDHSLKCCLSPTKTGRLIPSHCPPSPVWKEEWKNKEWVDQPTPPRSDEAQASALKGLFPQQQWSPLEAILCELATWDSCMSTTMDAKSKRPHHPHHVGPGPAAHINKTCHLQFLFRQSTYKLTTVWMSHIWRILGSQTLVIFCVIRLFTRVWLHRFFVVMCMRVCVCVCVCVFAWRLPSSNTRSPASSCFLLFVYILSPSGFFCWHLLRMLVNSIVPTRVCSIGLVIDICLISNSTLVRKGHPHITMNQQVFRTYYRNQDVTVKLRMLKKLCRCWLG